MKSIGKNVLSSFVEEEEEKQLLLQNLISLLQVPKVKETEELLLATNDAVLAILMQANTTRNGKMTMDMDPSFLGFAFSSLLELASGTRKNTNYQKIRQSSLKVVLELVRFVKHKVSTLAFFLPGIVSALVKLLHSSKNEWIDDLATEQCLYCLSEIVCAFFGDAIITKIGFTVKGIIMDLLALMLLLSRLNTQKNGSMIPFPKSLCSEFTYTSSRITPMQWYGKHARFLLQLSNTVRNPFESQEYYLKHI